MAELAPSNVVSLEHYQGIPEEFGPEQSVPPAEPPSPSEKPASFGLQSKIVVFLTILALTLAALVGVLSSWLLRERLTDELSRQATSIAAGFARSIEAPMLAGDAVAVQDLLVGLGGVPDVEYLIVEDEKGRVIAHDFVPLIPEGLLAGGGLPVATRLQFIEPATGDQVDVLDVSQPVPGGVGTLRLGLDRSRLETVMARNLVSLVAGAAVLGLLTLLAGMVFARRLIAPLRSLLATARRVGRGDLTQLSDVSSRDEIGQLGLAFDESIVRLRTQVVSEEEKRYEALKNQELQQSISVFLGVATEIARGDLTLRGEVTADVLGNVVDAINVIVERIGEILIGVRDSAERVGEKASLMSAATAKMASDVQTQASDARQASEVAAAVTRSARDVSQSAAKSASAAQQTLAAAQVGQTAVEEGLGRMQRIREKVQRISQRIKSLGDRSLEVSQIVDTISSISSQTNLLAVNAAIEASGAGESGLRFAVVAEEVRRLAEDTASATKRVAMLINSIQTEIQDAVVAMEEGTREVEDGYQVSTKAGGQLREIADLSGRSAELASEISEGATDQVEGIERVSGAVERIAEIAVSAESSLSETREAAESLRGLSQEVLGRLATFKLAEALDVS